MRRRFTARQNTACRAPHRRCHISTRSRPPLARMTSAGSGRTSVGPPPRPARRWVRAPTRPETRSPSPARRISTPLRTRPPTSCSNEQASTSRAAWVRPATPTSARRTQSPMQWSAAAPRRRCWISPHPRDDPPTALQARRRRCSARRPTRSARSTRSRMTRQPSGRPRHSVRFRSPARRAPR